MLIVLLSHIVEMVELRYRSLRCTGHINFNLSYSAIQWKWSNYDIGLYGVQGMLIICLIKPDGGNGQLTYWSLRCTGHGTFNLSYSAIWWKWSNYDIGPYGVQGMLIIILIKPDSGNGRINILVPTVYRTWYV